METDTDESGDKPLKLGKFLPPQKTKMGWYKVPRSIFDYAPAILDPLLSDLGVKESDLDTLPMAQVIMFERDAQTVPLIGLFLNMTVALSKKIIEEALAQEDIKRNGSCHRSPRMLCKAPQT